MAINDPIVIIGGGHMGTVLATRWRQAVASKAGIHIIETNEKARAKFVGTGITVHSSIESFDLKRGIVVLAVKPQTFAKIADKVKKHLSGGSTVIVSIMAGIALEELEKLSPRTIRMMPNTPAMVGEGMTVACNPRIEPNIRLTINRLFEPTGRVIWVDDENLMHAATAVSGSGPAYVFAFMEAFEQAARMVGLTPDIARQLVLQTVIGAAQLAKHSEDDPRLLRQNVTSPRGTTEVALTVMLKNGVFMQLIDQAVKAAFTRSVELAQIQPSPDTSPEVPADANGQ